MKCALFCEISASCCVLFIDVSALTADEKKCLLQCLEKDGMLFLSMQYSCIIDALNIMHSYYVASVLNCVRMF